MALSLKINVVEKNVTKTLQFDPTTTVYDACRVIRKKIAEAEQGQPKDYGLFLGDDDVTKGVWLESIQKLEYYILKNGDVLEYRKKLRPLRVRMLDGTLKTLLVDDSQPVSSLMVVICAKIGLTNHDEYGLVRELQEEEQENKPYFGTLTLKRKKEERDAKMDQLRKKLRTDDELNWVDPTKTLREQGVEEHEPLLLRRKFFFSDQNVDSRDPVELNLLYVQARDAILDGTHPVPQDKACEFAGIQCHVQFGDHDEAKHRPGFLDLKEFLPQSYVKVKTVEKKVFAEHRKHAGLSEVDAKALYTKTARALTTYGVTFFLVKEKMERKNKLVPRLLGVTKDSVLRLDENTKEIMQTWPLTTVRRWSASPNTFTLDFGDYSEKYYSVQTTEGEQIVQLISGYIDIILKKKKAKDYRGADVDEGAAMVEDMVTARRISTMQYGTTTTSKANQESMAHGGSLQAGIDGNRQQAVGYMPDAQQTTKGGQRHLAHSLPTTQQTKIASVLSEPQKALLSTINAGHEVIHTTEKDLDTRAQIPELGSDPSSLKWKESTLDIHRQNVGSQIAAMNVATSQMMAQLWDTTEELDNRAVGAAVTTITTNLPEMAQGVRMVAALTEDERAGDGLLEAARELCVVYGELLRAAEPRSDDGDQRQDLMRAAGRVGDASRRVLTTIHEEDEVQDDLSQLARAVADSMDALAGQARDIASTIEDQATYAEVGGAATRCELAASQLVVCAKVVAPTIHSPACQEQLIAAAREAGRTVSDCQQLLPELSQSSAEVMRALHDLMSYIKRGTRGSVQESAVEDILVATDHLLASTGDTAEMGRQTKVLSHATAQLIQTIKGEAESQSDPELRRRLLAAAEALADATACMVEAARMCASNPHDAQPQSQMSKAVEQLRAATTAAATPALRKKVIERLEEAAKQVAGTVTQCIAAAQGAAHHNSNKASQEQLSCDCKAMEDLIKDLVKGVKGTQSSPTNPAAQLTLINAAEQFLQPGARVVQSACAVLPTVADQASALQLNTSSQQLSAALGDLRSALNRAREVCGSLELDSASELIRNLQADLQAFQHSAESNELGLLPGETAETAALKLGSTAKNVESAMAHLLSAAIQGNENYTRSASRNTWSALRDFTTSVRGVAATTDDQEMQTMILSNALDVMEQSLNLIEEVRQAMQAKENPVNAQKLTQASKGVLQALNKCVSSLPGQKDVDDAIHSLEDASEVLERNEFPSSSKPCGQLQQELNSTAADFNDASAAIVSSVGNPSQLAVSSRMFSSSFGDLLGVSMEVAGQTQDGEMQGQMMVSLKNVFLVSSKLLATAKLVAVDPSAPNAKNQLAEAARAVTDSINHLIDVCTLASPGQKECDNAIREIQSMRPLLENPTEPHYDSSYFECLDTITEKAKCFGDGMVGIHTNAKKSDLEKLGEAVKMASGGICGLVEAAAQAAYLLGVSDPSSVAARPGLVDQAQFARAAQAIHTACQHLTNQQQALTAATVLAKYASALCNACRTASSKTTNPVAKRHFLQAAKDVANCTSDLVDKIKAFNQENNEQNRENCTAAMKPLLKAVDNLCTFAGHPEFASQPAKISPEARSAQEPILESGRAIVHDSCSIMQVAKSLAAGRRDSPTWQQLANHSKSVSESIKKLVTSIRDKAPGQKECDDAVEKLNARIRDLDQASLAAVSQSLSPQGDNNLQGFTEQTESSVREIEERLEPLRAAAKHEAENICHIVNQMVLYFEPLVAGAIGAASNMLHSKQQMELLDQTKTVVECALQLVSVTKEGGGNPKAVHKHPEIDESVDTMHKALQDMGRTLENLATQAGVVTGILDSIARAMARVTNSRRQSTLSEPEELNFVDYQTRMVVAAKEVTRTAQDMAVKCATDPGRMGTLGAELSRLYAQLALDATGAAAVTSSAEVSTRILSGIQELGRACQELVKVGSTCQLAQKDVADSARHVSQKVSQVLAALQAGSRGTQACINAAGTVSGIINDLDSSVMIAMAGTLNAEMEDDSFADHRDKILEQAEALIKDTNLLVSGATSSQEQLAVAAQNSVSTIVQLAEFIKLGAASLGSNNPDAQVMLINAVKDVSLALSDLIQATKVASGKSTNDPSMNNLKDSEKVMVASITSLQKTIKAVEDEQTRGRCALESTIEAIAQEIRVLQSPEQQKIHATPEELVRCSRAVTVATTKAVAASNSGKQDDVIAAANMGRKAISDMLITCKATASSADEENLRVRTLKAGQNVALQYRALLQVTLQVVSRPSGAVDVKQSLSSISRNIAQCITELVASAEMLKGTNWVDPDDPTVIAENELLGAAASIEAAAKKLASLRPRRHMQEVDENLNFDEMILEAAKSIAIANSALLSAATAAQRELVNQGKVSRSPRTSSDDGQWSEGLISAARLVAAATQSLVESANSLVQGMACEEMLISSAKKVASSTAQLILACKVKADPDAVSMQRLQTAGNAVKFATDSLVRAAQQAMKQETTSNPVLNDSMVGKVKQEMEALAEVLRKERELEEARGRLTAIRQARYKPES